MSEKIVGWRIKDRADPEVPYAIASALGHGWEWMTRSEARGRFMSRDVAVATLRKMREWGNTDEGSRFRMWNLSDLRLVRVVRVTR